MAAPETRGSTTARPEHPSSEEAEENEFRNNVMWIVNTFCCDVATGDSDLI